MRDFSAPYLEAKKLLEHFYAASISQNKDLSYQIANRLVEVALQLEDIAHAD
jgi:hypothetical protein